jgi:hypothetical protein
VAVWPLERLPDELGNVWQGEKVPAERRARIVEKLTRLCRKQGKDRNREGLSIFLYNCGGGKFWRVAICNRSN